LMMRTMSVILIVIAILTCVSPLYAAEPIAERPNIVLFLVDDLGYADLSLLGSDIQTPNIDSIARGGVRCSQAYVTGPVCAPSRAGLITGRYQHRFGFEDNPGPFRRTPDMPVGLDLKEQTIADRLKKLGNATGMVGKWHDGERPEYQPPARGFDEYYGFNNGAQRYLDVDSSRTPMMRGTKPERHGPGYLTDTFGREAAEFVQRHHDEPFFLFVSFNAPHGPLTATEEDQAKYASIEDPIRRTYAAMVDSIDRNVGRVLEKLRKLKLEENTLVVFLSDHGGVRKSGANWSDNGDLRAGKGTLFEGGLRTQLFMQWKKVLPPGGIYDPPVISLDLLPTAVSAAGGLIDPEWKLDGVDLLPYLLGKNKERPHEMLYWRINEMWAVRHGDWKIFKDRGTGPPQLFDLAGDPGERRDVAADRRDKYEELQTLYRDWAETVERPRFGWWKGVGVRSVELPHPTPKTTKNDGPNILFIFSDDHALRTIGAYGSEVNRTPRIDQIAREGAIFTRSYCTNSICCPSRASILTGKHSHQNGVTVNGSPWSGDQFVFTRMLSQNGYRTGLIGKWHLRNLPTDE